MEHHKQQNQNSEHGIRKFRANHLHKAYMYVYTDIISPRNVGEGYHPILSILPLHEASHEFTAVRNVQYFPVNTDTLGNISIKFADEYSNPLPVESSWNPTCVTLHFKRDL
jgi:hypothetical protein